MNREETLALWRQGQDIWNAWANDMLAEKTRLEGAGHWMTEHNSCDDPDPKNDAMRTWMAAATANFSSQDDPFTFETETFFSGWRFPGDARFDNATFKGTASFESTMFEGIAWFKNAMFEGDARFENATFEEDARFENATFEENARFENAMFEEDAGFERATFEKDAWFGDLTFKGTAQFESAMFKGTAWFEDATFESIAWFEHAMFEETARFESAMFEGNARFERATFEKDAWFDGGTFQNYTTFVGTIFKGPATFIAIKVERAFTIETATFEKVPDFIQANFAQAPRLDNSNFPSGFVEPWRFWGIGSCGKRLLGGNPDVPARWRALKRLAIQGHDHEREQQFFPMEIRTARFVTDWPLPVRFWRAQSWRGFFRFWFGIVYGLTSSYGQSVFLPVVLWCALALASATVYLGESRKAGGDLEGVMTERLRVIAMQPITDEATQRQETPCLAVAQSGNLRALEPELSARTDAAAEALHLAISNGSVVGGIGGPETARRTYGCLYGFVRDEAGNLAPIVPAWVSLWSLI